MPDWKLPKSVAGIWELSGYDKVLYAHLFTYPSVAKNPSVRVMAAECGMDMWTVRRSIRNLEKTGLIRTTRSAAKKKPLLLKIDILRRKPRAAAGAKKRRKKKKTRR